MSKVSCIIWNKKSKLIAVCQKFGVREKTVKLCTSTVCNGLRVDFSHQNNIIKESEDSSLQNNSPSCLLPMSDKRRFFKHTLIFGVGGIIGQLVPFILLPLYTNYLTPSEYGILDVIVMASDIITTVFLVGGIRLAAMTFYKQAESEEARRRVAVTVSSLLWFAVAAAIAVSFIFIDYIDLFLKTGEKKILAFGLAVTLLEALVAVPMTLTQARLESLRFVLTNLSMSLARLGLCIYFVAGLRLGIWGVLYAQAIVLVVSATYLTCRELRIGSIYPDTTKWREILWFCLPLVPNGILAFIYGASGRVSVLNFGPYEGESVAMGAVGLYALASRLMSVSAYMGVRPMQQVWTAEMYEIYKKPDASQVFGNFMLRLLCIQTFAALFISLFSSEIVRVLCDTSYHDAALLIPLFGLFSILALFANQMNNTFFITRKTNYNFFCTLFALPFVLLFMYLLVPRWGITGAIIAYIFAYIVYAGFIYFFTQRLFYVRYPFGKMAILLAITVLCYHLSLLCGSGIELSPLTAEQFQELSKWEKVMDAWNRFQWHSIIAKMGVMVLWGVLTWLSGILSHGDNAPQTKWAAST
jgi:O-antigen/teichoic acid export membrane protein